jgi:hypothetical protein
MRLVVIVGEFLTSSVVAAGFLSSKFSVQKKETWQFLSKGMRKIAVVT